MSKSLVVALAALALGGCRSDLDRLQDSAAAQRAIEAVRLTANRELEYHSTHGRFGHPWELSSISGIAGVETSFSPDSQAVLIVAHDTGSAPIACAFAYAVQPGAIGKLDPQGWELDYVHDFSVVCRRESFPWPRSYDWHRDQIQW
jgi:hypothetical protein